MDKYLIRKKPLVSTDHSSTGGNDQKTKEENPQLKASSSKKTRMEIEPSSSKEPEDEAQREYRTRMGASIDSVRFLLRQGITFENIDEYGPSDEEHFLELLKLLCSCNEGVRKVVLKNPPQNVKLIAKSFQNDLVSVITRKTIEKIVEDMGDDGFTVLFDEARDVDSKLYMTVILRYVNRMGEIIERFVGLVHADYCTVSEIKKGLDDLFAKFGVNSIQLRGVSYNGASDMGDKFNKLKNLIMTENSCTFYIHCFAHHLQSILATVAGNRCSEVGLMLYLVSKLMSCVEGPYKYFDPRKAKEVEQVNKELKCGTDQYSGDSNQEFGVRRAEDLIYASHHVLSNLICMFSSVENALHNVHEDSRDEKRSAAVQFLESIYTFDFAFALLLMKNILGKTTELSDALQRKDQDIVTAMKLVQLSKAQLNLMRTEDTEWDSFLEKVFLFCMEQEIEVKSMDGNFVPARKSRNQQQQEVEETNLLHYRFEVFNAAIDLVLNELNDRFNEKNTELLLCVACLDPREGFASFNKQKLIRLAQLYPSDFSAVEVSRLEFQLDTYILDVRTEPELASTNGISGLAKKLVELRRVNVYFLVHRLLKLALLLPIATASKERVSSGVKIIKNNLCIKNGDEYINGCLVSYVEQEVVDDIDNNTIIECFQSLYPLTEIL